LLSFRIAFELTSPPTFQSNRSVHLSNRSDIEATLIARNLKITSVERLCYRVNHNRLYTGKNKTDNLRIL